MAMIDKPGIFEGIPSPAYHADPCPEPSLSRSIAHIITERSPLHAWTAHPRLNPNYAEAAEDKFDLGSAFHDYVVGGEGRIAVWTESDTWRTNAAKAFKAWARENGHVPLLEEQWERVQVMAEAFWRQLRALDEWADVLRGGTCEATAVYREGPIWCRVRLDWLDADLTRIVDVKTTGMCALPDHWSRQIMAHGLDIQAVMYPRGVHAVTGVKPRLRFLVIEDTPPFGLQLIEPEPAVTETGWARYQHACALWAECLRTGEWPGYPRHLGWAGASPWAQTQWEERKATIGKTLGAAPGQDVDITRIMEAG